MLNYRIKTISPLPTPKEIIENSELIDKEFINKSRKTIENILSGEDKRLLVVVGPCSIHNYSEALKYAKKLKEIKTENLFIVMRVYFEKPRTCLGWKGFIYDPYLDDSNKISEGILLARELLIEITKMEIPIGLEFLDTITPQYLADLVSWGAIGARTTESQIHRQLASGLSMPVGFKNLTDGNIEKAIEGAKSASYPHAFLGINDEGKSSFIETSGNEFSHIILRGGSTGTNYNEDSIINISKLLEKNQGLKKNKIVIDCSHGNSEKNFKRQCLVAIYTRKLHLTKKYPIGGIMIESNINEGNQPITKDLQFGVSVTDACINIEDTAFLLNILDKMKVVDCENLNDARKYISYYDDFLINNKDNFEPIITNTIKSFDVDKQINEITKSNFKQNILLSLRLSFSERVAEIKLKENTFNFLKKDNSILELVTNMDVEKTILEKAIPKRKDDIMIKIMDLSKWIQVQHINELLKKIKIGYLFGIGTFSHEAVRNYYGEKVIGKSINDLYQKLENKEIDYALVPTYNIKIGIIYNIPEQFKTDSVISIPIELCVYSNVEKTDEYDVLYIEPHIEKEVGTIDFKYKNKVITSSSREGIMLTLNSNEKAVTIASKSSNNMLNKIKEIIDPNNRTYFSLIKNV
jgi:3-deoxy-7-phosphoheptulonate synthase